MSEKSPTKQIHPHTVPSPTEATTSNAPTSSKKKNRVLVRNWKEDDIPNVLECSRAAYPEYVGRGDDYDRRKYELQYRAFPEGQFLAELDGEVVGFATSFIIQFDDISDNYKYEELTGVGTFSTHNPHGDALYGADIAVHPKYQKKGISKSLYVARKQLMRKYNLRCMLAYGRMTGYRDCVGLYTPEEYLEKVLSGEQKDPALNAHLSAGYRVNRLLFGYVSDEKSVDICTLLEMPNPKYKPERRKLAAATDKRVVRKARICTAQYLLRNTIHTWQDFERTIEFFVQTADIHLGHFLILPELFTVQLFNLMPNHWTEKELFRDLAVSYTQRYLELFQSMAKRHNLFIIGGSHPILRENDLYNVAHLFTPSGDIYTQDKLHTTPYERQHWGLKPGQGLSMFETPFGRIAILICYDIEFPEISRILALAGTEILFVPYSTSDRMGHNRVSYCAKARAVENAMYVVTSGNTGTLMTRGYLLNYAESGIFTPSDFGFPTHAEAGRADPNIETVIVADLDLGDLVRNRESGNTRPLLERRTDLYELKSLQRIQHIAIG